MNKPDRPIRKFNPGTFQSDEEVIEQFVGRKRELDIALGILRENINSTSCQHLLVVAPRGRGKTMLLARVAAELNTDLELSERFLPVRFMEESHEVLNIADFWLETLFHLARESTRYDSEFARKLREQHTDLAERWNEEEFANLVLATVLDAADRLGKKLVLMVENLQTFCEDVADDFGWQLCDALQSDARIILLATATSRFEELEDVKGPFFGQFRILDLEPLNTEECSQLWQVISGDEVSEREIRPIDILTGGNPRLLIMVAEFTQHRSLRQLMEELVALIDENTEYFRSHLEALPKLERRVYLVVIDLWQPSSISEIAARARMNVETVSTMISRLVNRGVITFEDTGRERQYGTAERLHSIYYKLRHKRDEAAIVRNLINFMVPYYRLRHGRGAAIALWDELLARFSSSDDPDLQVTSARALFQKGNAQWELGEMGLAVALWDELLARFSSSDDPDLQRQVAFALFSKGLVQKDRGELTAVIASWDELLARFGSSDDPDLQELVAFALFGKGLVQQECGKYALALSSYGEMITRFGDSDAPNLQDRVAWALHYKGIVLERLGEYALALSSYEEVITRFGDSDAPNLRERIFWALHQKNLTQIRIGRVEKFLNIYEKIERRLGTLTDIREIIAFNKARSVWRWAMLFSKKRDIIESFRSVYDAFPLNDDEAMREMQKLVLYFIANGTSERDLIEVLSSDKEKSGALAPLIVALLQRAGEEVRAPVEVLEVAKDINKDIERRMAN